MNIKYNIQSIKNAQGNGKDREFVRLYENAPLSPRQLEEHIRNHTNLTPGALHGVLDTLGDCMAHALSEGTRFHLPGIGYFSLGARLDKPDGAADGKVRGNQIKVDGIKFRPEARLLARVKRNARFERARYSTRSRQYTEAELLAKIKDYLATNSCITRRILEMEFKLRETAALNWLRHFTETGVLIKDGTSNAPVYLLNPQAEGGD